jgi:membrane-associated phospholipid phosphatase
MTASEVPWMKAILYDWGGLNVWLFHLVNDVHGALLDQIMLVGTALGDHTHFPLYVALLGVTAMLMARRDPMRHAWPWLGAIAVFASAYDLDGWLLGWLKPYLDFPRPLLALPMGTVHVVGSIQLHYSLPSGHSSFAMLCAASVWPLLNRPGRYLAVTMVLWVGVSRVSLGDHFPADVAAGYLSSLLIVLGVRTILQLMTRRDLIAERNGQAPQAPRHPYS